MNVLARHPGLARQVGGAGEAGRPLRWLCSSRANRASAASGPRPQKVNPVQRRQASGASGPGPGPDRSWAFLRFFQAWASSRSSAAIGWYSRLAAALNKARTWSSRMPATRSACTRMPSPPCFRSRADRRSARRLRVSGSIYRGILQADGAASPCRRRQIFTRRISGAAWQLMNNISHAARDFWVPNLSVMIRLYHRVDTSKRGIIPACFVRGETMSMRHSAAHRAAESEQGIVLILVAARPFGCGVLFRGATGPVGGAAGAVASWKSKSRPICCITACRRRPSARPIRWARIPIRPTIRAGHDLFTAKCETCHAYDGGGRTEIGGNTFPRPPVLRSRGARR